ncbi:hypothetical protein ALO97_01826 [Pseudomonas syringae pv. tagetis]|nr:hypothetical protein ALO97_01826 [Pseudomonas syringae pv. tagetis]RMW20150.1 hypothetical protein ALO98_01680 [Pseudomonas syringae pv. tagetis]
MTLPSIHLDGSAYAIGHGLGVFGRDAVLAHLRLLELWQYLALQAQTPAALQMRQQVQTEFPPLLAGNRGTGRRIATAA